MVTFPRQPSEFPIFLALVATLFVFLVLARRQCRILVSLQSIEVADTNSAETSASSHRLKWPYSLLAAAIMFVAMIPYSPIWSMPAVVMLLTTHAMVIMGVFLVKDALKKRQHFALLMLALFMSAYVAAGSIFWYVVR